MRLSWNEIRVRAAAFARDWADATYEKGETQPFYEAFFRIFGVERRSVARYEEHVRRLGDRSGYMDLFWPGVLLVEQKSAGRDLEAAAEQADEYFDALPERDRPRYRLLSDFRGFDLYDRDERQRISFPLEELPRHIEKFGFILGVARRRFRDQDPVNIEAAELLGRLHDRLRDSGYGGAPLEQYLVRVLFCLFADDTGVFEPRDLLLEFLENRTGEDGADLGNYLAQLFQVLDTPEDRRYATLDEDLARFPYVNGDLFRGALPIPSFDSAMRNALLDACRFDWSRISPAIFGALFQSVMDPGERREHGAHYTTEQNILKVIEPLFLDDLRAEFARLAVRKDRRRRSALLAFWKRLSEMQFLDPACGCGNFLVIAYRELRTLEMELLRALRRDETYGGGGGGGGPGGGGWGWGGGGGGGTRCGCSFAGRCRSIPRNRTRRIPGADRLGGALDDGPHHEQPAQSGIRAVVRENPAEEVPPHTLRGRAGDGLDGSVGFETVLLRLRESAVPRRETPVADAARAGAADCESGRKRRHARLCGRLVPPRRGIPRRRRRPHRLRRHELDHAGRASRATLAAVVRAVRPGDLVRPPHLPLGFGRSGHGACACRDPRSGAPGSRSAETPPLHLRTRERGSAGSRRTGDLPVSLRRRPAAEPASGGSRGEWPDQRNAPDHHRVEADRRRTFHLHRRGARAVRRRGAGRRRLLPSVRRRPRVPPRR